MKIIAFVGMPASGKSEAARIAAEMGIPVINMGDVIRKEVLRRGLEPNDSNTGMVATDLRKCEGMDAVCQTLCFSDQGNRLRTCGCGRGTWNCRS